MSNAVPRLLNTMTFLWQRTRIVSYPNSGRTWLRVMLAELGARLRFTHAQSKFRLALMPGEIGLGMEAFRHRRVLLLVREPKDTAASNYHQVTRTEKRWQGDFKTFIRNPNYGFERIVAFNCAWIGAGQSFHRGFHLEFYEDMRAGSEAALGRIVGFLNIAGVSDADIRTVAERNQFDQMKSRENSGELFKDHGDRFTPSSVEDPNQRKVRRGRIGGFTEDMDSEDIAYCDAILDRYDYAAVIAKARREAGYLA